MVKRLSLVDNGSLVTLPSVEDMALSGNLCSHSNGKCWGGDCVLQKIHGCPSLRFLRMWS